MAGVIATLRKPDSTVDGGYRYYPNGFINIISFMVDLNNCGAGFEYGRIVVSTLTYLTKADFDADPNDYITLNKGGVPLIVLPYVRHSDPVDAAIVQLKEWFPDAVEV